MYFKNFSWNRNVLSSFILYLRDAMVFILPFHFPSFLIRLFYGFNADFVFLVHPRRSEDYFIALPFLSIFRKLLGRKFFLKFVQKIPSFVIGTVKTKQGVNGLILSSLFMPQDLLESRRKALMNSRQILELARKVSKRNSIIGLGGWWPIVTKRGEYLDNLVKTEKNIVTSGHSVTLLSIVLTVVKISNESDIAINRISVIILGVGKIGAQLTELLYRKGVRRFGFYDTNFKKMQKVQESFVQKYPDIDIAITDHLMVKEKSFLSSFHLGVCAASSVGRVVREEDIPEDYIIIDDSRPEGIVRNISENKIVLEGGLIKVPGAYVDYDFGFGIGENMFGCMAESFFLGLNKKDLAVTIGNVDVSNLDKIQSFMEKENFMVGDYMSGGVKILSDQIINIITKRDSLLG